MAEPTPLITGRLTKYPFISQLTSVERRRKTEPQILNQWFYYWESHLGDFKAAWDVLTDEDKTRVIQLQRVFEAINDRNFSGLANESGIPQAQNMVDAFNVLPDLVNVVGRKHAHGLMVVGPGGVGKSYTVLQTLQDDRLVEGRDFIRIPGYSSPAALYNNLFDNNGKLIIFDDCDSIFGDPTGLNILKSVLDTLRERKVAWNTTSKAVTTPSFIFTGRIIFISNMDPNKTKNANFAALLTRVLTLVIQSTPEQIVYRMVQLLPTIGQDLDPAQREELIIFIHENYTKFNDLSLRFLVNLVSLRKYSETKWRSLALSLN